MVQVHPSYCRYGVVCRFFFIFLHASEHVFVMRAHDDGAAFFRKIFHGIAIPGCGSPFLDFPSAAGHDGPSLT
jgi:hypothetical protein